MRFADSHRTLDRPTPGAGAAATHEKRVHAVLPGTRGGVPQSPEDSAGARQFEYAQHLCLLQTLASSRGVRAGRAL